MKLYEPRWHASKYVYRCHTRRVVDFAGHPLIINSTLSAWMRANVIEAFEVKDGEGNDVGIVFSTPTSRFPPTGGHERIRNKTDWHAINIRHRRVKDARPHWGSRNIAITSLIQADREYWKNKRGRTVSPTVQAKVDQDMADIAAAFS